MRGLLYRMNSKIGKQEYARLISQYAPKVIDFVSRMVDNYDEACDVAQEAFVKGFRLLATFRGDASFLTWMQRIAYHEALNHLHRHAHNTVALSDVNMADEPDDSELSTQQEHRISLLEEAHQFDLLADNGKVVLNETFMKEQLLTISDRQGNQLTLFADSIATLVNLKEMSVKGSPQNEQFAQVQRQLKALEPEMHKYAYSADDNYTIIDGIGHQHLLDDAHQLLIHLLDENTDNLIPVWLLATNFNSMNLDELTRYLRHDRPYAKHVALQPVWQYCEGLAKRQPGRMFADAQCVDTTGASHRLSEYIGQGEYVVLQFWEERNWTAHSQCKYMKQIAKEHCGENIRIIGLSLDSDKQRWKRYVKKRDLCYHHLATTHTDPWLSDVAKAYGICTLPETIVFSPDGSIISTGLSGENLKRYVDTLPLK